MSEGLEKEIKILKKLVKAQNRMIMNYKTGVSVLPNWVFDYFDKAKSFYGVESISEIKQ